MKLFYLVLIVIAGDGVSLKLIPNLNSLKPITCDDMFEKTVTFIENPRYKQNNDENWMLIKYKNYNVIGHYCVDDKGNYYNGYEEVLNFELGHD